MQSFGDFTVFKIAAVRHLGFVKFKFLMVRAVKRSILHQRTKFRKDPVKLGFSKIRNVNGQSAVGANVHHHAKFHHDHGDHVTALHQSGRKVWPSYRLAPIPIDLERP